MGNSFITVPNINLSLMETELMEVAENVISPNLCSKKCQKLTCNAFSVRTGHCYMYYNLTCLPKMNQSSKGTDQLYVDAGISKY